MEDSNANQATSQSPITNCPSPTARHCSGPRTAEGKRRSCQNARKHGLYTDERFLQGAALELGDDPRQFQRLLKGLVEARQPVGALETALVEGIALLLSKQARLDRSELAVQVSNLHHHDLERRKLSIKVGHDASDAVESEVREKGLRRSLDAPGKFEQVLGFLTSLLAMIDKNEFGYEMREALIALYGSDFTLRGVKLDEFRYALAKMPEGEAFEKAKNDMTAWVAEELADVEREYELFLHEHVENTRAARMAATAPSQAQWAAIIRQQNSLDRQLERKIRLLMELQRERKSEAWESLEASSPPAPGDPQDGATRARSCRRRTRAPAASHPSATGMTQTSSCEVCDVPKGQARTGDSIQEIENRGNELKDLLQRQGITEIVTSKRTHFRAERAALGAERSGISRIVTARRPLAGAILHDPGSGKPCPSSFYISDGVSQPSLRFVRPAAPPQVTPATVSASGTSV